MHDSGDALSHLIPKSSKDFSDDEYWHKFFEYRKESFEWYAEYIELSDVLHRYMRVSDNIVVIGCGNSCLSVNLYDYGFVRNTSIDNNSGVIKQMSDKYVTDCNRNGLKFVCMDVFDMKFDDNEFNVVIDKGTLDAIASQPTNATQTNVELMFTQINRVMKTFGRYICVSLLQPYILNYLLNWFSISNKNYLIRIEKCFIERKDNDSLFLPVFVVICTKLLNNQSNTIFELLINQSDDKPKRVTSVEEVRQEIKSLQEFAFIQYYIKNFKLRNDKNDIKIDLYNTDDAINPRYTLYFVKSKTKKSKQSLKCGVFIVPQRREIEWLFGTFEGRIQLTKQSGFQQLIIVHLNRNHNFINIDQIKNELSPKVLEFLPKDIVTTHTQVPYLSIGEDVGKTTTVYKGHSDLNGEYVIEDITIADDTYRRLVFMNNQNIIQSEAKLKRIKKGKKWIVNVDHTYLACKHHEVISCGLALLPLSCNSKNNCDILLIGLGGGCLPSFLRCNIKCDVTLNIKVVEIDSLILEIANKWYDFNNDIKQNKNKIEVEISDGLKYIADRDSSVDSFNAIIFDVDSKDLNIGMSCPPQAFIELEFLSKVKSLLIERNGVFILNLVARNEEIKKIVHNNVKQVFDCCFVFPIKEELNEIVFAFSTDIQPNWLLNNETVNTTTNISNHCFYVPLLDECYNQIFNAKLKQL